MSTVSTLHKAPLILTPNNVITLVKTDQNRFELMDSMSMVVINETDSQQHIIFCYPENSLGHILLKTSTTNSAQANAKMVIEETRCSVVYTKDIQRGLRVKLLAPWGQDGISKLSDTFEWDQDGSLTLK